MKRALVIAAVLLLALALPGIAVAQSATVMTDKADYAPGEIVTITGSGWQPGETVTLQLAESPAIDNDTLPNWAAVADADGNIFNNQFSPDQYDLAITFTLTATGNSSGFSAQTMFTDAASMTLTPNTGAVGASVSVTSGGGPFGNNATDIGIYWDGTKNTTNGTLLTTCSTNNGGNILGTCTFNVPSSSAGPHTVVATQQSNTTNSVSATFTVTMSTTGRGQTIVATLTLKDGHTVVALL